MIILILIGFVAMAGLLFVAGYAIKAWFMPVKPLLGNIDAGSDVIDKTYTAENAIYNYEWFKTQYEKIQANRQQVDQTILNINEYKQMYGNVSTWDYTTKEEYNRLNTIKLGLINQENNLVAEYNARAKMANRNIFNDKLPFNVDKMLW